MDIHVWLFLKDKMLLRIAYPSIEACIKWESAVDATLLRCNQDGSCKDDQKCDTSGKSMFEEVSNVFGKLWNQSPKDFIT